MVEQMHNNLHLHINALAQKPHKTVAQTATQAQRRRKKLCNSTETVILESIL